MNSGVRIDWSDHWWSPIDKMEMMVKESGRELTFANLLMAAKGQTKIYPPRLAAMGRNKLRNGPPIYFMHEYHWNYDSDG